MNQTNIKIDKEQLNKIHDLTKYYYRETTLPELSPDELRTAVWIKTVYAVLMPEITVEFPTRNMMDEGQE